MSRKDYEIIARVVATIPEIAVVNAGKPGGRAICIRSEAAREFASALQQDNPRFNEEKFLKACGL